MDFGYFLLIFDIFCTRITRITRNPTHFSGRFWNSLAPSEFVEELRISLRKKSYDFSRAEELAKAAVEKHPSMGISRDSMGGFNGRSKDIQGAPADILEIQWDI